MKTKTISAVARKEYYHLIRDFRSLYLAFAIPVILILLFGYALSLDVDNIRVAVVDYDRTDLSRDFLNSLSSSPYFLITGHLRDLESVSTELDYGRITLAIVIPPGWTGMIRSDKIAPLQIILDGSDPNFSNIARTYITAFVDRYNNRLFEDYLNRHTLGKIKPPLEGRIRVWFNEDLESRNFIIPGIIAIIIMIVGAILTSLVIAREFENGTMETIRSLPITASELLLGKSIPYFFIGLTDVLIAVLMSQILFGVVMKSSFLFMILASSLYLMVALALGLLISSVTKSQLIANQGAILLTYLPSLLLSDFIFPVTNMPKILQILTYLVPATYYVDILRGVYLKNLGFSEMWPNYAVLAVMVLMLMSLNIVTLRKEGL
ncbi:MAG: ABC transporter permease [Syntrophales bacterium]|jgi:ABC-2 type transport system permease protein|nr:ABC transporter permease [Syntrophales bacterium]